MPKYLLERCRRQKDSIRSFRSAAAVRYADGIEAAGADRRTAAIYLWGYTAEMILKAAYFARLGFAESDPIERSDLRAARTAAINAFGILWPDPGMYHNIRAWAELVVASRSRPGSVSYPSAGFGDEVKQKGKQIEPIWNETLRYHRNIAYGHEVDRMRDAVTWLFHHSLSL